MYYSLECMEASALNTSCSHDRGRDDNLKKRECMH